MLQSMHGIICTHQKRNISSVRLLFGLSGDDLSMDVLVAAADRWALAKSLKPSNELEPPRSTRCLGLRS